MGGHHNRAITFRKRLAHMVDPFTHDQLLQTRGGPSGQQEPFHRILPKILKDAARNAPPRVARSGIAKRQLEVLMHQSPLSGQCQVGASAYQAAYGLGRGQWKEAPQGI